MAGYTRNDTGNNIADGNVINASDLDGEYNAIEAAFNASTGHTHDGTAAEGAPIEVVGPAQDLVVTTTKVEPKTDNTLDLGSLNKEFKDLYLDGTANIDSLVADTADINAGSIDGITLGTNSAVTEAQVDNINIDGNAITSTDTNGDITISPNGTGTVVIDTDLDVDNININGNTITSTNTDGNIALTPDGTGEVDISKVDIDSGAIDGTTIGGATPAAGTFTDVTADGTIDLTGATVSDGGTVTTVDINGGTIDGATIATSDITVGAGKTLDVSAGTLTLANDQISGDKIDGGTIGTVTVSDLTATTADINGGTIDGVTIGGASAGAGTFTDLTATGTTTLAGASTSADITFGDNDKAIFGAGSDLEIYHSGTQSIISDAGTGNLNLEGDTKIVLRNVGGTENYAQFFKDGAVELYYDNALKLATTATGIDVTGNVSVDGGITNLIRIQKFTSSGTYTPSTNATKAVVHVVGGGGAGGGSEDSDGGFGSIGTGGNSGGIIVSDVIDVSGGSYTSTITIGSGGSGSNASAGGDGGDTTYADGSITLTAAGGIGGKFLAQSGGFQLENSPNLSNNSVSGHTPILNTESEVGDHAFSFVDADVSNMVAGGNGGSCQPYGSGGRASARDDGGQGSGRSGEGFGAGGGGAVSVNNSDDARGGNGADGVVIVYEYL